MNSRKNETTKKKNIVDGKNTQELKAKNSETINLKLNLKTCLTTPTRKKVVTPIGKNTIVTVGSTNPRSEPSVQKISGRLLKDASLKNLEDNQLVQARRKIFEVNPTTSDEEERKMEDRRLAFEEKIKIFEKTTPKRRRRPENAEKMTPTRSGRVERSSHHRKVYGVRGKERGKMLEGLRLGHPSACMKIGNFHRKV